MVRGLFSALVVGALIIVPIVALGWYVEFGAKETQLYHLAARIWGLPAGLGVLAGLLAVGVAIVQNGQIARKQETFTRRGEVRAVAGALLGEMGTLYRICHGRHKRLVGLHGQLDPAERIRVPPLRLARSFAARPDTFRLLPSDVVEDVTAAYANVDEINVMVSDLVSPNRLAPDGDLVLAYETVLVISARLSRSLSNISGLKPPELEPVEKQDTTFG